MTSVLNRRQQLSGSRLSFFLIVTLLFSASCGLLKPKTPGDLDYGQDQTDNDLTDNETDPTLQPEGKVDTVEWTSAEPLEPPPSWDKSEKPTVVMELPDKRVKRDRYKVVMMLPFFTNRFGGGISGIPDQSTLALEFYEGARLAFRQLEREGLNMDVNVIDTQADSFRVKDYLYFSALQEADLIIGPVTKDNSSIVATFGKSTGKTVVSPLNPRSDITVDNPFYVQVNPSTKTQYDELLKYIRNRFGFSKNVVVISPEGKAGDSRLQYIQEANKLAAEDPATPDLQAVKFRLEEGAMLDLKPVLVERDTNIVIVPSRDQGFVGFVLRELSLLRKSSPIVVFGMSQWENFERVDYSYFENLNVHIMSSAFVEQSNGELGDFKSSFQSEYGAIPGKNAYRGYDIALYFGRMLKENGVYFQKFLTGEKAQYSHTGFAFEPVFESGGVQSEGKARVQKYENKFVNILAFKGYKFQRVNSIR